MSAGGNMSEKALVTRVKWVPGAIEIHRRQEPCEMLLRLGATAQSAGGPPETLWERLVT